MKRNTDLPVIQKTYDLILWFVPLLNRLPREHRYVLGERMMNGLYDLQEDLVRARYAKQKVALLEACNLRLEVLRQQTRLLLDFKLIEAQRFQYAAKLTNGVGVEVGGWIKQQKEIATPPVSVARP